MRPSFDTFAAPKVNQDKAFEAGSKALGGSNSDVVANRSAIRMANMSAAEALKAELANLKPLKPKSSSSKAPSQTTMAPPPGLTAPDAQPSSAPEPTASADEGGIPGLDVMIEEPAASESHPEPEPEPESSTPSKPNSAQPVVSEPIPAAVNSTANSPSVAGVKRKLDEIETFASGVTTPLDEEESQDTAPAKKRVVHADGTVETEDTVKSAIPVIRSCSLH